MNKGISNLIESLHLLPSNSHLSHLLIRIERSWNDYYSRTLNTSRDVSTEEKDKASNKLKVLLLELIEALGEIQLSNGRPNSISSSSAELQNPGDLTSVTSKIDLSKLTAEVHDVIVELSKVTNNNKGSLTPELRRKLSSQSSITLAENLASSSISIDSLLALNSQSDSVFPSKALQDVYTLYCLANFSTTVLPPGKTLLSLLKDNENLKGKEVEVVDENTLESRVRRNVEQAYFDDIESCLSSTTISPEQKNLKWNQFLSDLWKASNPLVPSRIKEKPLLQLEFATTTSFSLQSATKTLHHLLLTLAKLVAPARDTQVYNLIKSISTESNSSLPSSSTSLPSPTAILSFTPSTSLTPHLLVEAIRSTLAFTQVMKSDLDQFKRNLVKFTPPTELELKGLIEGEARKRERATVEAMYNSLGIESVKSTIEWICTKCGISELDWKNMKSDTRKEKLSEALIEMLFTGVSVGFPPNDSSTEVSNIAPPIFVIPLPNLFKLQNLIQAFIILACLISLAPETTSEEMIERLFTILSFESKDLDENETRLANLSDELTKPILGSNQIEIKRIRDGVNRILRYEDPVYNLLKNRLKLAIQVAMKRTLQPIGLTQPEVPVSMKTGRVNGEINDNHLIRVGSRITVDQVKGFDKSELLSTEILNVGEEIDIIMQWGMSTWLNIIL